MFGPQVAIYLGVPFVPIRKKGKLPGPTISASYQKEYGVVSLIKILSMKVKLKGIFFSTNCTTKIVCIKFIVKILFYG